MNDTPLDISVVIPIYNAEEYLLRCLRSVLKALGSLRYEVLLLDDGSTDSSAQIAQSFAESHEGFNYSVLEHGGQGRARNIGIDRAKGTYIQFTDADDMLVPGILEDMVHVAQQSGSEVVLQNITNCTNDKVYGAALGLRCFSKLSPEERTSDVSKSPQLVYGALMTDKVFLRQYLLDKRIRFSEGVMFEDLLPGMQAVCLADSVTILRTRGYYYRNHVEQTTKTSDSSFFFNRLEEIKKIFNFLDEQVQDPCIRKEYELKILDGDFWLLFDRPEDFGDALESMLAASEDILRNYVSEESIESMPVGHKQLFKDILNHDTDHFLQVAKYRKEAYAAAPIEKKDNGYCLQLPKDLFPAGEYSVQNDFRHNVPYSQVRAIEANRSKLTVTGHMFSKRISLTAPEDMHVRAWLVNERTGTYVEGAVERMQSEYLTKQRYDEYAETHYCYDWAGFTATFDTEECLCNQNMKGKNYLLMHYEMPGVTKGYRVLRGITVPVKKKLPAIQILFDTYRITTNEEPDGSLAIWVHEWQEEVSNKELVHKIQQQQIEWETRAQEAEEELKARTQELKEAQDALGAAQSDLKESRASLEKVQSELKDTQGKLTKALASSKKAQDQLQKTKASWSYRIGRKATWAPRQIRRVGRKFKR